MEEMGAIPRYTSADAARKLGITPAAISHWIKEGKIEYTRLAGGGVRFTDSQLEALARVVPKREE